MSVSLVLFLQINLFLFVFSQNIPKQQSFQVDYENDRFLKDGLPFSYISGEMHYFRIPRIYWRDRLEKLKAVGCTTVSTYVEWSFHEPSPGEYHFSGERDIFEFLNIAQELNLTVILRPGPYICAERDFGGFPAWLLTKNPNMKLRTSDPSYMKYVENWFRVLMPKIQRHLYGNGGNIIMVQVENEYGSYPENDINYLTWLRDLLLSYTGNAAVLFTTDGWNTEMVTRGQIPGVLSTVDFGPTYSSMEEMFAPLRTIQPKGPLVNSEMYVGWISYWGRPFAHTDTNPIVHTISALMERNISFSMYMLHGGTNFAFTSGSGSDTQFIADITSYDYDAPISEAGDLTPKYTAIRETILNKTKQSQYELNKEFDQELNKKANYGQVTLRPICSLFSCPIGKSYPFSKGPVNFEALGQYDGFVSYSTVLEISKPSVLRADIRDRAVLYLDDVEFGVLQYTVNNKMSLPKTYQAGQTLRFLIENMGRRNYGLMSDCTKGLVGNVTIDGQLLNNWTIKGYPFSLEDIKTLNALPSNNENISFPAVFRGEFVLNITEEPSDTFLSMADWGKGIVFVNGFNLGRYWHIGPQVSLYVPRCFLRPYPEKNIVIVAELHFSNPSMSVSFESEPRTASISRIFKMNVIKGAWRSLGQAFRYCASRLISPSSST